MRKTLLSVIGATVLALSAPASAVLLSLTPAAQTIGSGAVFSVELRIAGLGDGSAPSLGGYDLDIGFDPAVLAYESAVFGDPVFGDQLDLSMLGLNTPLAVPGVGNVNLMEVSLFDDPALLNSQQHPQFALATLSFKALNPGSSVLSLTVNSGGLSDADGAAIVADIDYGNVTVTSRAIPEPPLYALLLSGLLGMGITTRFHARSRRRDRAEMRQ